MSILQVVVQRIEKIAPAVRLGNGIVLGAFGRHLACVCVLVTWAATCSAAAEPIWLEGESPARTTFQFSTGGWGQADTLSGGKWLYAVVEPGEVAAKVPADGLGIAYDFDTTEAGGHAVWARIGYEFARAPFRWRVDAGEWATVEPDTYTTDLMALAEFAEVAWIKLGTADLKPGKHTVEFRVLRRTKTVDGQVVPDRVLFGLDAVCVAPGEFVPNGPHRSGSDWQSARDKSANTITFAFPKGSKNPADRRTLSLGGTWQVARFDERGEIADRTGPITDLPTNLDALHWKAVRVPADFHAERPEWAYCHRFLYRVRVDVPKNLNGRSFVLRFPNNSLITTVFVNGTVCGHGTTPAAPWACDITKAVRPGKVNEIVVGVKDAYYAIARTADGKSARHLFNLPPEKFHAGGLSPTRFADFPVMFKVRRNGILEPPTLTAAGPAYTADVFCVPSVSKKTLGLELTLRNSTELPLEVELRNTVRPLVGGATVKNFAPIKTVLMPDADPVTVKVVEAWDNAELWWPDDPRQYVVETTVLIVGKPADRVRTKFGFREWGWAGTTFTLNGVPWQFRADLRHTGFDNDIAPDAAVAEWKKHGQNMVRVWGDKPWTGDTQEATLDFFDAAGVPVRRSGTFDGEVASYQLVIDGKPHTALFENWRDQLEAWVKAERNHPSVFIWSIENEVTYINARNFGWLPQVEPEIEKAAKLVMALDPTRPAMIDGGNALKNQSLAIYGNHYPEQAKRNYPDEAYTLSQTYAPPTPKAREKSWPIAKDKPLFIGESFFADGRPPAEYAEIIGESAFLGRTEAAAGVAKFARILSEGYRWHGVAAFHFWFAEGPDAEHYHAWQPVCVFCREWDTTFAAGTTVTRTLKVFNDTRHADPITVHWLFQTRGVVDVKQIRGKKVFDLPPGENQEFTIDLKMPAVPDGERVDGDLVLTCMRGGNEVYRDVKPVRLLGESKSLDARIDTIALWDPRDKSGRLLDHLAPYTSVADLESLPKSCKLLIVGPDAVTPELAADPIWTTLAAKGLRILVLDQANPLRGPATPADLEPTDFAGRIAFPENPTHPAFANLGSPDFFGWSGDHVIYRNAYRKPSRAARSLVQCDTELSCSALVECPVGDGLLLLSQLNIGAKPNDPVARRVIANLLRYARDYKLEAKPTAVVMPDNDPRAGLLTAAGLKFATDTDSVAALGKAKVVIVDATPANLKALAEAKDKVRAFADAGGWLVLWNVSPNGLADFNRLVGFDHVMRPFGRERVTLAPVRDPLAAGLTLRDVALESAEKIYPWAGDRYPADDTFTHAVDLTDIAPFAKSDRYGHGWSQITNGLTSADSWKFIFYHNQAEAGDHPSWAAKLPHPETVTGLSLIINGHYRKITKLRVVFDGKRDTAVTLDVKPEAELRQEFTFPPRECRTIALEPLAWTAGDKPVIGLDNIRLHVRRPADFGERVVPLSNVGTLVKYPIGKGGILLNQVKVSLTEANPANADRKRNVMATLLRNLGAEFAAE